MQQLTRLDSIPIAEVVAPVEDTATLAEPQERQTLKHTLRLGQGRAHGAELEVLAVVAMTQRIAITKWAEATS